MCKGKMNDSRLKCKRGKTISYNLPTVNLIWRRLTTKYIISIKLEMEFVFEMFLALWNNTWLSLAITEIPNGIKIEDLILCRIKGIFVIPVFINLLSFFNFTCFWHSFQFPWRIMEEVNYKMTRNLPSSQIIS